MRFLLRIIDKLSVWYYYWAKRWFLLLVFFMPGCVTMQRLKMEKYESYTAGARDIADLCLRSLEEVGADAEGIEEIKKDLRFISGR